MPPKDESLEDRRARHRGYRKAAKKTKQITFLLLDRFIYEAFKISCIERKVTITKRMEQIMRDDARRHIEKKHGIKLD
jgi:hypothetical protein